MKNTIICTVRYGMMSNNPNRRGIERKCNDLARSGYRLVSRNEHPVGCFVLLFTSGLARGKTELTFNRGE